MKTNQKKRVFGKGKGKRKRYGKIWKPLTGGWEMKINKCLCLLLQLCRKIKAFEGH